jgi:DNA-binding MarR family transcriptional regulator
MTKAKSKAAKDNLSASPTHLLHRALQLALDFHAEAAGASAITQRQFTVLSAASGHEGLTQNDLVRATGIDRSTLADLVARLLTKGLLLRERSATDGRANTVRLSPAGREALDLAAGAAAAGDKRLLGLLSPKKRETFMKILGGLAMAADNPPATATPKMASKPRKASKAGPKKKHSKAGKKRAAPTASTEEAAA